MVAIVWTGIIQNNNQKKNQLSAQKHVRNQWDNLKPMNPHRAAHYGSYVFKPVSIFWDRINRPEQIISSLQEAMRLLTDPAKTGAVTICLPQDVQAEAYNYPERFFDKKRCLGDRVWRWKNNNEY